MSKTRNLSDLLDANGDVKSTALDNVPSSNDASALTTGTLDNARLPDNISDSGTEGTKIAVGTTAQRGTTQGQFRFNSTTGLAEYYDGANFKSLDNAPIISSVDVTEVDSQAGGNETIVITGTNFSTNPTVLFTGNSGTNITPATVVRDSSTQITTTTARSSFLNAQEPYGIKVTNFSGLSGELTGQINVDSSPVWTTASGNIADINEDDTGTHATVSATDFDNDTIVYSETGGTVLTTAGLTLNSSTGAITGDPTDVYSDTTYNFTLRATANSKTADRAFNIIVRNVFVGGNQSDDNIELIAKQMLSSSNVSPTAGGTLTINGLPLGSYDYYKTSGSTTISSFSSGTYFTGTQDTRSAFCIFDGDLTLNSGQTFIPSVRKLFTVIYVNGNLTVNGAFKMTARGANHSATTKQNIKMISGTYSSVTDATIPATGGSGATGNSGTGGTAIRGSGGGGGGGTDNQPAGDGASGTCFSGGGGGSGGDDQTGGNAVANGGRGGNANGQNAGGGAGNPAGTNRGLSTGQNSGTGGTLLIYCTGTLSGSGSVQAKATDAGTPSGGYRGGGGAGGGIVQIFCNSGSISTNVAGGAGTTATGGSGGSGGAGADDIYTGYSG
jgi:hypothetical protein